MKRFKSVSALGLCALMSIIIIAGCGTEAKGQCVDCSSMSSVVVQQTVPVTTAVTTYSTEYVTTSHTVPQDGFSPGCALEGAAAFSQCRTAGGRFFGCLIEGVSAYGNCNGGFVARVASRGRTRRRARAISRTQRRLAIASSSGNCF